MPRASVLDLLATGRLGPLGPGSTREDALRLLGSPDDHLARSSAARSLVWKYGDVELHFAGPEPRAPLTLVQAETFSAPGGRPGLAVDPWILSASLRRETAEAELTAAGITFRAGRCAWDDQLDELRTAGGASLLFAAEGDPLLRGLTLRVPAR